MKTLSAAIAASVFAVISATPALAQTGVRAQAIELPQNTGAHAILGSVQVDSANHSFSSISSTVGSASARADVAAGRVSGISIVDLHTLDEYAAGAFQARGQASGVDKFRFGSAYCIGSYCTDLADLGITSVGLGFKVQASGGVTAFALDDQFGTAEAGINYSWRFDSRTSVTGGGETFVDAQGHHTGSITSQTGRVILQPGDYAELLLKFETFAAGSLPGFRNSMYQAGAAVSEAQFNHTLKWGGVTDFQAFDANGDEVALASGGRFSLLDDQGNDFWFGSDSFGATAAGVPEPATWAMMILGFGLAGAAMRRRERGLKAI